MGRIAEALKRAEQERRAAAAKPVATEGGGAPIGDVPSGLVEALDGPEGFATDDETKPVELVEGLSEALVPYYERSSLIAEQYRSLRTRLLSQNPQCEHRVLAITSAVPKEGKSVTTLNLGAIFAEVRHLKVLVVDGDFRRSSLAKMLNQPEGPGLADALGGRASFDEIVRDTPIPNLRFMPAGSTKGRSAAELLASAATRTVFKRVHNEYHYIFVDTPPATTVTDVGIIGQMCSGVIMVVRLNRTHEAAGKRAVRLLQSNNIRIIGALIVGRETSAAQYGYGYGYGHHYDWYYNYYYNQSDQNG